MHQQPAERDVLGVELGRFGEKPQRVGVFALLLKIGRVLLQPVDGRLWIAKLDAGVRPHQSRFEIGPIEIAETDFTPINLSPKGEPQLGRRGLYATTGGDKDGPARAMAYLWVLNLADGSRTLLDLAERARMPYRVILAAARALMGAGLVAASDPAG